MLFIYSPSSGYEHRTTQPRSTRKPLHPVIRFEVLMRDQRRCTDVKDGERCSVNRNLEIHHIIEISKGGDDSLANLQTLCSRHHQDRHPTFQISSQRSDRARDRFGMWIREPTLNYCA